MIGANRILLGRCVFSLHIAPTHPLKPNTREIRPRHTVQKRCMRQFSTTLCKPHPTTLSLHPTTLADASSLN
jgi:hypothetical protein